MPFFEDYFQTIEEKVEYLRSLRTEVFGTIFVPDDDERVTKFLDMLDKDVKKGSYDKDLEYIESVSEILEEIATDYQDLTLSTRADQILLQLFDTDDVRPTYYHSTWGAGKIMDKMCLHQTEKGNWSPHIHPDYRGSNTYNRVTKIGARSHGHNGNKPGSVYVERLQMMVKGIHSSSQEGMVFDRQPDGQQTVVAVILSNDQPWVELNEDSLNPLHGITLFYAAPDSAVICGRVPPVKQGERENKAANVNQNGEALTTKAATALRNSIGGNKVRVIRKAGCSDVFQKPYDGYDGYRYDGLYRIVAERSRDSPKDASKKYPVFEMRRLPDSENEGVSIADCMQHPSAEEVALHKAAIKPIERARRKLTTPDKFFSLDELEKESEAESKD